MKTKTKPFYLKILKALGDNLDTAMNINEISKAIHSDNLQISPDDWYYKKIQSALNGIHSASANGIDSCWPTVNLFWRTHDEEGLATYYLSKRGKQAYLFHFIYGEKEVVSEPEVDWHNVATIDENGEVYVSGSALRKVLEDFLKTPTS